MTAAAQVECWLGRSLCQATMGNNIQKGSAELMPTLQMITQQ